MAARKLLFSSAKLGIRIRERLHLEDVYEDDHELRLELLTLKDVRRANDLLARNYARYNSDLVAMVEHGRQCSESLIDVARLLRARGEVISEEELSQETVDKYLFSRELREVLVTVGRTERDVHDAFSAFSRAVELNMIKPRRNFTKSYCYGEFRQKKLHYKDVKRTFKAHQKNVDEEPGAVERFELAEARAAYEDAESQLRRYAQQLEVENDESMRQTIANLVIQHHAALVRAINALEKILPLCLRHAVERGSSVLNSPMKPGSFSPTTTHSVLADAEGISTPLETTEATTTALFVARIWLLMYRLQSVQKKALHTENTAELEAHALRTSTDSESSQLLANLQGRVTGLEDSLRRERTRAYQLIAELQRKQKRLQRFMLLYWSMLASRVQHQRHRGAGAGSAAAISERSPLGQPLPMTNEPAAVQRVRRHLAALYLQAVAWHALYRRQQQSQASKADLSSLVESELLRDLVRCREQCNRTWSLLLRERERRHAFRLRMRCRLGLVPTCVRFDPLVPSTGRYLFAALHRRDADDVLKQRGRVAIALDRGSLMLLTEEAELEYDYVLHGASSQAQVALVVERLLKAAQPAPGQRLLFLAANREANMYTALGTMTAPGMLQRWILEYFQGGHYIPLVFEGREYHTPNSLCFALERYIERHASDPVCLQVTPATVPSSRDALFVPFAAVLYEATPQYSGAELQRFAPFAACIATVGESDKRATEVLRLATSVAEQVHKLATTDTGEVALDTSFSDWTIPERAHEAELRTPDALVRTKQAASETTPFPDVFPTDATSIIDDGEHDFNETSSLLRSYLFG